MQGDCSVILSGSIVPAVFQKFLPSPVDSCGGGLFQTSLFMNLGGIMLKFLRFAEMSFGAFLLLPAVANAQGHRPKTDAEHIANAMSAGPLAISRDATIMAMDG